VGILFIWAKENQDIQYKQGMNEILAIIVFAYFAERLWVEQELDHLSTDEIISDPDLFT
jgi:TBC1 domain family protein 5